MVRCPISPAVPAAPRNSSPLRISPAPDAVRQLDVDPVLDPLQGAASQLAQRGQVRGVVDQDGACRRASHLVRHRRPRATRAGCPRYPPGPTRCPPERAARRPPRGRRPCGLPAFSTRSSSSRDARSMPSSAAWSAGSGIRWRPMTCSRSGRRRPPARPGRRRRSRRSACSPVASETSAARRPLRMLGASTTTAGASSSLTMFETVAGDRPVTPRSRPGSSPPGPAGPAPDASGWLPAARPGTPEPAALRSQVVTYSPSGAPRRGRDPVLWVHEFIRRSRDTAVAVDAGRSGARARREGPRARLLREARTVPSKDLRH